MSHRTEPVGEEGRVKLWQPKGFEGLEVQKVSMSTPTVPRTLLHHYEFTVALQADESTSVRYMSQRHQVRASPASPLLLVKNQGEAWSSDSERDSHLRVRALHVDQSMLQSVMRQAADRRHASPYFPSYTVLPTINDHLARMTLCTIRVLEDAASQLERESVLLATLVQIVKHCSDDPPRERRLGLEHRAVTLVKDYLNDTYASDVTLDDLSQLVGLNKYHLLEVFKRDTNISPHGYLSSVRIARAKDLLARGTSLAQTALEVGLADQSHLNRVFKKYVLLTPGQYQKDSRQAPTLP